MKPSAGSLSSGVRYGELLDEATRLITVGTVEVLSTVHTPDGQHALAGIEGFHRVLRALDRHVRTVAGDPHRSLPASLSRPATLQEQALHRFLIELRTAAGSSPPRAIEVVEDEPQAWLEGARVLGAASDLLATYFDPTGRPRSPDSIELEDPLKVAAALVHAAELTRVLLAAHPHLALRAGQAGRPWPEVAKALPLMPALTEAVEDVHRTHSGVIPAFGWEQLTVAHPSVERGDPWAELGSRLDHLRLVSWELTQQPTPDLRVLDAIAASAVIVLRGAHTWIRQAPAAPTADPRSLTRLEVAIAAWSDVRLSFREVRSIPGLRSGSRVDPRAFDDLTRRIVSHPWDQSPRPLWETGLETLREVAIRNQATVEAMGRRGLLHIRGRFLRGDDITDYPRLVEAKLHDSLAPVPPAQVARISAAYRAAASPTSPASRRTSSPPARHRDDRVVAR